MRRRDSGVSLIELIVAIAVMAIALFGMISVISFTTRSNMATRENMLAMRAAEKQVEEMGNTTFAQIFSTYSTGTLNTFDVTGLVPSAAGVKVGKIKFAADVSNQLLEDLSGALMNNVDSGGTLVNFDLDGNGTLDSSGNKAGDYRILPVVVELNWKGVQGTRQLSYKHIFLKK